MIDKFAPRMRNLVVLIVVFTSFSAFAHKTDSVGTKVKDGKRYVLHKVEKGDGLYSISKRYNVNLKSIVDENPGSDEVIKLDQVLMIPIGNVTSVQDKVVNDYFKKEGTVRDNPNALKNNSTETEVTTFAKYHNVELGQTLYAISKIYGTSVEMIKTLNDLITDELTEGQKLMVPDGKAKTTVIDTKDDVETDYEKMKAEIDDNKYKDVGFDTPVSTKTEKTSSGYTIKVEKLVEYNIEKVEETGTMSIGGDKIPADKNFALHFNAPLGTVIMVTNPATQSTVFVKVIGNYVRPETSSEIIKLSSLSAQQIAVKSSDKIMLSYAR
jgi:LysM repeat protein